MVYEGSALRPLLNTTTMVGVQHVQLSLRQSVRITLKLLLQRKDDVDEVDDVLIAHEGLNDTCLSSLSCHLQDDRKLTTQQGGWCKYNLGGDTNNF